MHYTVLHRTALQATNDLERERHHRVTLEKSLLESQSNAALEIKQLTREILDGKKSESLAKDEIISIRDERDKVNERYRSLQSERDLSSARNEQLLRDLETIRADNKSVKATCSEYEVRLLALEHELLAVKQLAVTKEREVADRCEAAECEAARILDLGTTLHCTVVR